MQIRTGKKKANPKKKRTPRKKGGDLVLLLGKGERGGTSKRKKVPLLKKNNRIPKEKKGGRVSREEENPCRGRGGLFFSWGGNEKPKGTMQRLPGPLFVS